MTNQENIKIMQKMNDRLFTIYDELRFDEKLQHNQGASIILKEVRELLVMINELKKNHISSNANIIEIKVMEDLIISPGEVLEVKTNITDTLFDRNLEIIFEGSIPSDGFLTMFHIQNEKGIEIFVKNQVPTKVDGYDKLAIEPYCDVNTTRYFGSGNYRIEKGQIIGIGIRKERTISEELEFVKEMTLNRINK